MSRPKGCASLLRAACCSPGELCYTTPFNCSIMFQLLGDTVVKQSCGLLAVRCEVLSVCSDCV